MAASRDTKSLAHLEAGGVHGAEFGKPCAGSNTTSPVTTAPEFARSPLRGFFTRNAHLKRLVRRSGDVRTGDSPVYSPLAPYEPHGFGPISPATISITSPHTPRTSSPRCNQTPDISSKGRGTPIRDVDFPTITRAELIQLWSHAIDLATKSKNQSARLLFTHLLSRKGVPKNLLPYISMNVGLIMLKEHANFPALHIFHIAAKQLSYNAPLRALSLFVMGIAAWSLAISNDDENNDTGTILPKLEESLEKSKVFFRSTLQVFGQHVRMDYNYLGLPFKLERINILENIHACDRAINLYQVAEHRLDVLRIAIVRVPSEALFLPLELRSPSELFDAGAEHEPLPYSEDSKPFAHAVGRTRVEMGRLRQTEDWAEEQLRLLEPSNE